MNRLIAAVLAPLLLVAPKTALADASFPDACSWVSEVTPDAVIRFTRSNGVGLYSGALLYKGTHLLDVQQGQSQGYGNLWWSTGKQDGPSGAVVVFSGQQPVRGSAGFWDGKRPIGAQRLLLVGLVAALYYGDDQRWRDDHTLLTVGEGFWRSSAGCRSLP